MGFSSLTHRKHWLFTKETLRGVQEETGKLAAEACAAGVPPEGSRSFAVKRSKARDIGQTDANEGGGKEQVSAKPEVKIEGAGVPAPDTTEGGESGNGGGGKKRPVPSSAAAEPMLTVEEGPW
eukprot:g8756.t2